MAFGVGWEWALPIMLRSMGIMYKRRIADRWLLMVPGTRITSVMTPSSALSIQANSLGWVSLEAAIIISNALEVMALTFLDSISHPELLPGLFVEISLEPDKPGRTFRPAKAQNIIWPDGYLFLAVQHHDAFLFGYVSYFNLAIGRNH